MKKWIVCILLIVILLSLTACSKDAISSDQFCSVVTARGFTIVGTDTGSFSAVKEEYYISYFPNNAESVYTTAVNSLEMGASFHALVKTETSGSNYKIYEGVCGDRCLVICCVDDTAVLSHADAQYLDQIRADFDALGYR